MNADRRTAPSTRLKLLAAAQGGGAPYRPVIDPDVREALETFRQTLRCFDRRLAAIERTTKD